MEVYWILSETSFFIFWDDYVIFILDCIFKLNYWFVYVKSFSLFGMKSTLVWYMIFLRYFFFSIWVNIDYGKVRKASRECEELQGWSAYLIISTNI